jgi:hypothetical protein
VKVGLAVGCCDLGSEEGQWWWRLKEGCCLGRWYGNEMAGLDLVHAGVDMKRAEEIGSLM